jgi:hypothetical protein
MHAVSFNSFNSTLIRSGRVLLLGGCVLVATAACGSTGTTNTAATSTGGTTTTTSRTAYDTCLQQHGAVLPTAKPSPGAAKTQPDVSASARAACASLKPAGKGGGGHKNNAAVEAFDSCMASHGATIPAKQPDATASPKPTGVDRFLHGLNPDSTAVAAALKACESDLPAAAVNG